MHSLMEIGVRAARLLAETWSDAQRVEVPTVSAIHGGWSKRMYALDARVSRHGRDEELALILRVNPPEETALFHNSRYVEHVLLERLRTVTDLPVPRSFAVDTSGKHFGAQAMILERLPGNPRITSVSDGERAQVAEHLVELLAVLHTTDRRLVDPDGLLDDPNGWGVRTDSWDGYMESMCEAWIARYRDVAFDTLPVIYDGFLSLRAYKPRPLPLAVLHGELNPNNLLTRDGRISGLIDWERTHVGDPREDLAWFRYFERAMAGTNLFGSVRRPGGFLSYYNELTGFDVTEEELDYFTLFSHSDVSYGPYASIKRGLRAEQGPVAATYFVAEAIGAQVTLAPIVARLRLTSDRAG